MGYRLKVNPNGMVSKKIFLDKLKELTLAFPTWKADLSKPEVVKLYYKHLGYIDNERFITGIDKYISTETFNPTIAAIRKCIDSKDQRDARVTTYYKGTDDEYSEYVFEDNNTVLTSEGGKLFLSMKNVNGGCSEECTDELLYNMFDKVEDIKLLK